MQTSSSESDHRGQQNAPVLSGHTPTPWRVTPSFPSEGFECYWLTGNFGPHNAEKEIGTISGPQSGVQAANAAFIVRAVNSHEVLVKALEKIAALDPPRTDLIGAVKLARHIAKCALASAREAQP